MTIDEEVEAIYNEIYSLDTAAKQRAALLSWWEHLQATCTTVTPCIECRREAEPKGLVSCSFGFT